MDWAKSVKDMFALVTAVYKSSVTLAASVIGIWYIDMILVIKSATPPFCPTGIVKIEASLDAGPIISLIASNLLPAIARYLCPDATSEAVRGVISLTSFANCNISLCSAMVAPAIFEAVQTSF